MSLQPLTSSEPTSAHLPNASSELSPAAAPKRLEIPHSVPLTLCGMMLIMMVMGFSSLRADNISLQLKLKSLESEGAQRQVRMRMLQMQHSLLLEKTTKNQISKR